MIKSYFGLSILILGAAAIQVVAGIPPSPVADAVESGDGAAFRRLLQQEIDVNAPQVDGMTALHWAAYHDDLETAKLLVDSGADVTAQNRYGVSPLSLACKNGNGPFVELLLDAGADPNIALRGGETALMTAARTGQVGPVKALLAHGADVNAEERTGQTAIMWAAADGHAAVIEELIEAEADFLAPLESGFTPLFFAVRAGRTDAVQALLKAGADVNETIQGRRSGRKPPRKGTSPLMLAVENGHFELAVDLLKAGADPNDQRSGYTPLHAITWVRKPNRGDGADGDPAPTGSGNLGSLQFVKELVAHGADVNAQLERGRTGRGLLGRPGATPFLMASDTADVRLMQLLVELGADPLLPNAENATPLMAAAGLGTRAPREEAGTPVEALEAARLALELGGDVNAVSDNGETAMHGAAYKNLPNMVRFLAENGADIEIWNRTNDHGWTPLSIAQGYRVGNFKPSAETVAAIKQVMRAEGVSPPSEPPALANEYEE